MSLPRGWVLDEVEAVAIAWRPEMAKAGIAGRLETVLRVIAFIEGNRQFLDEADLERLDELIARSATMRPA